MDFQGLFKNKVLTQASSQAKNVVVHWEGACFLLSGNEEFSSTGSQTSILYEKDFELYIDMLQKPTNKEWSLRVINHFNDAIFSGDQKAPGPPQQSADVGIDDPTEEQPKNWEDNILAQLGDFVSGSEGANSNSLTIFNHSFSATPLSFNHPTQPAADPTAQLAVNPNFHNQSSTIAMNPLSITGA
ncbi:hypothetical protein PAXRUDRAFT_26957 [Paxillus rubicundulus Ve08.2h10]|uniref:Uncharacterized protein n=1 Tax=Paxillus rubicundulus Ve08.2h10 TaxID=930991 RepID=A0A0D0DT68_9AGAM|nr:hypothetical protein PAXRUDRAFT_26957 [Paxillus rubicundulus Ve08.2h10]